MLSEAIEFHFMKYLNNLFEQSYYHIKRLVKLARDLVSCNTVQRTSNARSSDGNT